MALDVHPSVVRATWAVSDNSFSISPRVSSLLTTHCDCIERIECFNRTL